MKKLVKSIMQLQEYNNKDIKALFSKSLFYYCSGKDPSPIIAFGASYPLYIYNDIIDYGIGDFNELLCKFYEILQVAGFKLIKEFKQEELCFNSYEKLRYSNYICTYAKSQWQTEDGEEFLLLYIKGDANKVFKGVYFNDILGNLLPKCICNYRYEMVRTPFLQEKELQVDYIFGYCFSPDFEIVGEYSYFGPYGVLTTDKIKLYKNMNNF